jgi:hypothetical protein
LEFRLKRIFPLVSAGRDIDYWRILRELREGF